MGCGKEMHMNRKARRALKSNKRNGEESPSYYGFQRKRKVVGDVYVTPSASKYYRDDP